jgi:transcriptional regulator of arginine metabolism
MQKIRRLLAIERIIAEENISSQDELLKKLKGEGIGCTQATLSRNLRQLGVLRIPNGTGGYRYSLPDNVKQSPEKETKLNIISIIKSITDARGMIVMRTIPGHANSAAFYIDNAGRYEIAGTIAGDDTILIVPRDNITQSQVHACLEMILPGLYKQIKRN